MVPGRHRLFLGLLPPAHLSDAVADGARKALGRDITRVYAAGDLHLTLVFLGDVPLEAAARVESGLQGAFEDAAPVALRVAGTGSFPTPGHARTLWAGFDLAERERLGLLDLVARGRRLATEAGIELAARDLGAPYVPHLTLARPRPGERVPPEFAGLRFDLDWRADEVCLFESAGAGSPGGRYPVRASCALRGA